MSSLDNDDIQPPPRERIVHFQLDHSEGEEKDSQIVRLPESLCKQCKVWRVALESDRKEDATPTIGVPHTSRKTFDALVEYLRIHYGNPAKPIEVSSLATISMKHIFCTADVVFAAKVADDEDGAHLVRLMLLANYVDCEDLLTLMVYQMAVFLQTSNAKQIAKRFGAKERYTREELKEVQSLYPGLFS